MPNGGPRTLTVFLVATDPATRRLASPELGARGWVVETAQDVGEARDRLSRDAVDVVLLDPGAAAPAALQVVEDFCASFQRIPVVVLVDDREEEALGLASVRRGAQEYLARKHATGTVLDRVLRHAYERHRVRAALRASEERFRVLVESMDDVVFTLDRDGRHTGVYGRWLRQLGLSPEVFLGRSAADVLGEEAAGVHWDAHRRAAAGEHVVYEWSAATADGERHYQTSLSPIGGPDGQVTQIVGVGRDITALHRAESTLRESEARYRSLVETTNDLIWAVAADNRLAYVNRAVERILGYRPEEVVGTDSLQYLHPGDREEMDRRFARLVAAKSGWTGWVLRWRHRDGSYRYLESNAVPLLDDAGNVVGYQGADRDITERRRAEEELRRTVSLLTATLESTADGILALDNEGRYVAYNQRFAEMWNIPAAVLASRDDRQVLASVLGQLEDPQEFLGRVRALHHLPDAEVSDTVEFKDGRIFERYSRPQRIEGAVVGRVFSFRDVTERRRAEEALRESESLLRSVVEGTTDAVFVKDLDGRYRLINSAGARLVGKAPEAILGCDDTALFAPEAARQMQERDREIVASGAARTFEETATAAGVTRTYLTTKAPHLDAAGRVLGVIGIARDVTELKRSEEALLQAQKLESLGILAGGVAHDFNNLLAAILGQSSLALRHLPADSPARGHVEKAMAACERAADLTRQMLAYSGRGHFRVEPVSLNSLVRENLHLFEAAVPKGVLLRAELAEPLPLVRGDVGQLQQVLMNLILNAAEAIGERQGTVLVTTGVVDVRAEDHRLWRYTAEPLRPGRYVFVEVRDDGAGMDAATLERIFDPFFTTKFTGRGLGLAAVLGIVRGHAGGLDVTSEPGRGSRFRLVLPTTAAAATAAEAPPAPPASDRAVLIIDDESALREAVRDMLGVEGIRSLDAPDGPAGLEILRRSRDEIGLVLLDLSMARMSGEETFREICAVAPEIPVLLCSGYAEAEATRYFEGPQLVGFVQKPYTLARLVEAVRRGMRRP
jgi:PAS domain S-box-containing protein